MMKYDFKVVVEPLENCSKLVEDMNHIHKLLEISKLKQKWLREWVDTAQTPIDMSFDYGNICRVHLIYREL